MRPIKPVPSTPRAPRPAQDAVVQLSELIGVIAFAVERSDVDHDEEIRRMLDLLGHPRTNGQVLARAFTVVLPQNRRDRLCRSENGAQPGVAAVRAAPGP
jgi:hypothetical protein